MKRTPTRRPTSGLVTIARYGRPDARRSSLELTLQSISDFLHADQHGKVLAEPSKRLERCE
jgi:uncharacterized protein involved in type VI secretion and phage assembly